jgi:hypothetical protein
MPSLREGACSGGQQHPLFSVASRPCDTSRREDHDALTKIPPIAARRTRRGDDLIRRPTANMRLAVSVFFTPHASFAAGLQSLLNGAGERRTAVERSRRDYVAEPVAHRDLLRTVEIVERRLVAELNRRAVVSDPHHN